MSLPEPKNLGLCSWSVQPGSLEELIEKVKAAGLGAIQLALEPLRRDPENWADAKARLADAGITIHSGMFQPVGEDYTTPATIRETGGIVPDGTWDENLARWKQAVAIAGGLELTMVTLHAGFIPEEADDPGRAAALERLRRFAGHIGEAIGGAMLLETGQETAGTLIAFLEELDRPNVGVNFDPANMLLYDMGEPIPSLRELLPHVKQAHLKDATRPATPGAWGTEVVLGAGEVDWRAFCATLRDSDFAGQLVIEREAGGDRVGDIRAGAGFITPLLGA